MAFRNLVIIDGREVELKDLDKKEREHLADYWNRRAAESICYKEEKTA